MTFDEAQSTVLDAAMAVAGADGEVCAAEFDCVLETLRCMFGRVSTSGVERAVRSWKAPTFINFVAVEKHLDVWQRQLLFQQLAGIAAADQMIAPEEHRMLVLFANHFGMPTAMADLVLGAQLARFDRRNVGSAHCPVCGEATTSQARFCSACGASLGS